MRSERLATVLEDSRSGFWGTDAGSGDVDVRVVRNGDVQEEGIRWTALPLRGVTGSEAARAAIRKDDILITTSGDCGCAAHVTDDPAEPTIASNFVRILRFDMDRVVPRYMFRCIHSAAFRARLRPYIRGTTLKNLSLSTAAEHVSVPLPDKAAQRRIAGILDKADALRAKRRTALVHLDMLAQSIFLDMFGDPATNPKEWPITTLGDLISVGPQNGLYRPASDYGSGTPILRIDSFYDGVVTGLATLKRVRISSEEIALYGLKPGEIVVNRVNSREYLGKSALIPDLREPTVFESNMMRFGVDARRLHPIYLIHLLQTRHVRAHILRASKDAVNQSSINQQDVKSIPVALPPLPQQERFARYVRASHLLADAHRSSGVDLDALFASLQAQAFVGEL